MKTDTKTNAKLRKLSSIVSLCIIGAILLGQITLRVIEKRKVEKLHDNVVTAGQAYLQTKYGFTTDLTDETEYPARQRILLGEGIYEFSAEYNGRKFYVWVNSNTDDTDKCKDSYQYEDMFSEIKNRLYAEFPTSFIHYFWIGDDDEWETSHLLNGGFSEYYDGSNLDDILKKSGMGNIKFCVANASFKDSDIPQMLSDLNFSYCLTAFDNAEHLNEFQKLVEDTGTQLSTEYTLYKYAYPYITENINNLHGEVSTPQIVLHDAEDFVYSYLPIENSGFPVAADIAPPTALETKAFTELFYYAGSKTSEGYDERQYVDTPVSVPHYFECGYGDVMIYYPLEKLKKYRIEDISYAWYSRGGFSNNRNIEKPVVFGDYAVLRLQYGEMYFMLVNMSGKGEYTPGWAVK